MEPRGGEWCSQGPTSLCRYHTFSRSTRAGIQECSIHSFSIILFIRFLPSFFPAFFLFPLHSYLLELFRLPPTVRPYTRRFPLPPFTTACRAAAQCQLAFHSNVVQITRVSPLELAYLRKLEFVNVPLDLVEPTVGKPCVARFSKKTLQDP